MRKLASLLFLLTGIAFNASAQDQDSVINAHDQLLHEADSLMANFKFERARDLLDILANRDSLNTSILLRLGQCNFRLGASTAAIKPYEQVLKIDSVHISALNQLGQLYSRDGDFAKAQGCYVRLLQVDSTNSYYYKQLGSIGSRAGEKSKAKFWYASALRYNPADAEASLALGNILMDLEEFKAVDSVTQIALAVDPQFRPMILLQARSAFEQGNYPTVVTNVSRLLQMKPDTTETYARMLGVSYFHLREYEKSITMMNFLLLNRYDHESVYYYLGMANRELGNVPASIAWLKRAAEKSISDNTKIYYSQLGQSYEMVNDYQGAIRAYRAAYTFSKDGILLYHLARNFDVYYKDKSMALEYYKKYLDSEDTIRLAREYARKRMRDMGVF